MFSSLLLPQSCQDVDQKNDVCFSVSGATLGFEGSDSQQSQISIVNEVGEKTGGVLSRVWGLTPWESALAEIWVSFTCDGVSQGNRDGMRGQARIVAGPGLP